MKLSEDREKIIAMLDGKTLTTGELLAAYRPDLFPCDPFRFSSDGDWETSDVLEDGWALESWTIEEPPRKRPMTRNEMLAWAVSEEAHGWVVRESAGGSWGPASHFHYSYPAASYERARMTPDGPGEPEPFEMEA